MSAGLYFTRVVKGGYGPAKFIALFKLLSPSRSLVTPALLLLFVAGLSSFIKFIVGAAIVFEENLGLLFCTFVDETPLFVVVFVKEGVMPFEDFYKNIGSC